MKRYGIITHYGVHNHGALLQLTALVRVLARDYGIKAKALRFEKNYDFLGHALKAKYEQPGLSALKIYLGYLKEKGIRQFVYNVKKRRTLQAFKGNELIGDFYSESEQLDGVVVGSDEVFALHTGPTPVFFGHCLPSDNVFAYAGSFGPTTMDDIRRLHSEPFVKSGLMAMKGVSVRDDNSREVVRALTGEVVPKLIDPVLLYGFENEIAQLKSPAEKNYLLVYAYDNRMNSSEEVAAIMAYAKSRGLKTLSPGFYHSWCDVNVNTDPINLLAYFKNATEVITDTFHGSIMSAITGARFVTKTREENRFKLTSLLAELGLAERIISDFDEIGSKMDKDIDYDNMNQLLRARRAEAHEYLKKMTEA